MGRVYTVSHDRVAVLVGRFGAYFSFPSESCLVRSLVRRTRALPIHVATTHITEILVCVNSNNTDMLFSLPHIEPSQKWIRVQFAGEFIVNTKEAKLVYVDPHFLRSLTDAISQMDQAVLSVLLLQTVRYQSGISG